MNILLTGSSGFLGKVIKASLIGENVITVGRKCSDIICDLSNSIPVLEQSNLVIHNAGKAHFVPSSEEEGSVFYKVNVEGTKNLLIALNNLKVLPERFVFISSVAVYGMSDGNLIDESTSLCAKDPYGLSKIQAEALVQDWCSQNNVIYTIFRLPLVAGPNPPGNLGAMINAIKKGYYFNIAGGKARKSIVLSKDVAKFILPASMVGGVYNLTDGCHPTFFEMSSHIAKQLNKRLPLSIPAWVAEILAQVGDLGANRLPFNTYKLSKIRTDLTFDDTKARFAFGWDPEPVLKGFSLVS